MHRDVLVACLPYIIAILVSVCCLRVLVGVSGGRLDLRRLWRLHRDQSGAVQSLSFVITLPLFMMIMLLIVQMSQLVIGRVVVEYAAFAAARSAAVWIPANLGIDGERENRISRLIELGEVVDDDGYTYSEYGVEPEGVKYNKIHFAAAMACMPICPSRDVGTPQDHPGNAAASALTKAYFAYAPESIQNTRIPARIRNKLAYALDNTHVEIRCRHKDEEPELIRHDLPPYPEEFTSNEIGWQDQILVTVTHDFALLPGPGRLLARPTYTSSDPPRSEDSTSTSGARVSGSSGSGSTSNVSRTGFGVFIYPLSATVRLGNEGEKPVLPYVQRIYEGGLAEEPYDLVEDDGIQYDD